MELSGKKIAILATHGFEQSELEGQSRMRPHGVMPGRLFYFTTRSPYPARWRFQRANRLWQGLPE
jgi:hypothetical protein